MKLAYFAPAQQQVFFWGACKFVSRFWIHRPGISRAEFFEEGADFLDENREP